MIKALFQGRRIEVRADVLNNDDFPGLLEQVERAGLREMQDRAGVTRRSSRPDFAELERPLDVLTHEALEELDAVTPDEIRHRARTTSASEPNHPART